MKKAETMTIEEHEQQAKKGAKISLVPLFNEWTFAHALGTGDAPSHEFIKDWLVHELDLEPNPEDDDDVKSVGQSLQGSYIGWGNWDEESETFFICLAE